MVWCAELIKLEKIPKVTCSIEAGDYLKITIDGKTQPRMFQANEPKNLKTVE